MPFPENSMERELASTELHSDYARLLRRIRPERLGGEMLIRAARFRKERTEVLSGSDRDGEDPGSRAGGADLPCRGRTAIDATGGMGEDTILLAAAGYAVDIFERNPKTAALLKANLRGAASYPGLAPVIARIHFHEGDSVEAMQQWPPDKAPDLVYLDPMFPARTKSAKVKKKLQVLQTLEEPEDPAGQRALLAAAMAVNPCRIVIKRPAKGPFLADRRPDYSIRGKVIRYDVMVVRAQLPLVR